MWLCPPPWATDLTQDLARYPTRQPLGVAQVADALVAGQWALATGIAYAQSPIRAATVKAASAPVRLTARLWDVPPCMTAS
jgi:hypothetical protein